MYNNPFPNDPDRHQIWEMLVERDIQAFMAQDWDMIAGDFIEEGFMGIDGKGKSNPDSWQLTFPSLAAYRDEWLRQAQDFADTEWGENAEAALAQATTLRDIEIVGEVALLHKKFDGQVSKASGERVILNWQTLYRCRKVDGRWKIAGFTGYLPHPMGFDRPQAGNAKNMPEGASQHVTAGPYSPVLEVHPGKLIVISGQASIDPAGTVVGDTIEEQTHFTLQNCQKQLQSAGCTLEDVFKVNIYLKDIHEWARMNEVYKTYFPRLKPVRTAVGSDLLMTLRVEIEMWAVKR